MTQMFAQSKFNGDISQWNISNVKQMADIFADSVFNQDLTPWADKLAYPYELFEIKKYMK